MPTMTTSSFSPVIDYAAGYAAGRRAAGDKIPAYANPYRRNTDAYRGWDDGHYDEKSARAVQHQRNSAAVWERKD